MAHTFTCVLMSMFGGGTATIAMLNRECVLISMLGGGATTISTLKRVCVLMSMLGGGTAVISILNCVCVQMSMLIPMCAHVNAWRWQSHNLHVFLNHECVLMSMLGGATTIPTLKRVCAFPHVNAW